MDRNVSVRTLGLRPQAVQGLVNAERYTLGDVQDHLDAGNRLVDINGIGPDAAARIMAALAPDPVVVVVPPEPEPDPEPVADQPVQQEAPQQAQVPPARGPSRINWGVVAIVGLALLVGAFTCLVAGLAWELGVFDTDASAAAVSDVPFGESVVDCLPPGEREPTSVGTTSFTASRPEYVAFYSGATGQLVTSLQPGEGVTIHPGQFNYARWTYLNRCAAYVDGWARSDTERTYISLGDLQDLINETAQSVEPIVVEGASPSGHPSAAVGSVCPAEQVSYHYPDPARANIMAADGQVLVVAMWVEEANPGPNKGQYVTWVGEGESIDASAYSVVTVWSFGSDFDAEEYARGDLVCFGSVPRVFIDPANLQ